MQSVATGEAYRVAFLLPYTKIGKYAVSTTESALAYLAERGKPFQLEVVKVDDEEESTLREALDRLTGYHMIIAPVTEKGAEFLCSQTLPGPLFIPTLHEGRVSCANDAIRFGGIDYDAQIRTLSYLVESNATTYVVTDGTPLSRMLTPMVERYLPVEETLLLGGNGYYKSVIERYEDLNASTMFLNTPVVKTSLFLSQLTLADFKPARLLSPQLNYSPRLLTLTQYHDRENLVVASSIGDMDPFTTEYLALVGRDVRFNWLNYATVTGLDHDFCTATGLERKTREFYEERSLHYEVRLYDAGLYRFVPREIPEPPIEERSDAEYDENPPEDYDAVFPQESMSE
jgi:hypothetical protein